jgi:hypothetical protein
MSVTWWERCGSEAPCVGQDGILRGTVPATTDCRPARVNRNIRCELFGLRYV